MPLDLARDLIAIPSTSRDSNQEASDYVQRELRRLGFGIERLEYTDAAGVRKVNILGKRGEGQGGLAYFGHTDCVPADDWQGGGSPFAPQVRENRLYGRGACDMKGSVAAMLAAARRTRDLNQQAPLYVVCTADEEVGYHGARQVQQQSELYREMVEGGTRGIIGEPTRLQVVHGHKGTYGFRAVSHGRAAHSSTREGKNANLAMIPFLSAMLDLYQETESDPTWQHPDFDPPTVSWNIGINDFTRAINITPAKSVCTVYFRPMPGQEPEQLMERARVAAERCGVDFEPLHASSPLYVDPESPFVRETLQLAGQAQSRTVAYGTDGCIFTDLEHMVVLGPGDIAQAHTADEWIGLEQLEAGCQLYTQLIHHWCGS